MQHQHATLGMSLMKHLEAESSEQGKGWRHWPQGHRDPNPTRAPRGSQIPVLFRFFHNLADVIVSCCAFDASKSQTALASAIFRRFVGASWQQFHSNLAPEIADTSAVSLFLPSRWCCCDVLRVRCFENSNSTGICDFPPLCWSLLATILFKLGA